VFAEILRRKGEEGGGQYMTLGCTTWSKFCILDTLVLLSDTRYPRCDALPVITLLGVTASAWAV
jgi:hypothetical protein